MYDSAGSANNAQTVLRFGSFGVALKNVEPAVQETYPVRLPAALRLLLLLLLLLLRSGADGSSSSTNCASCQHYSFADSFTIHFVYMKNCNVNVLSCIQQMVNSDIPFSMIFSIAK